MVNYLPPPFVSVPVCRLTARPYVSQQTTNVNKTAPIQLSVAAPFLVATGTHYTPVSGVTRRSVWGRETKLTCASYVSRDRYFLFPLVVFILCPHWITSLRVGLDRDKGGGLRERLLSTLGVWAVWIVAGMYIHYFCYCCNDVQESFF